MDVGAPTTYRPVQSRSCGITPFQILFKKEFDCSLNGKYSEVVPETSETKYLPAVLLGRRNRGKSKKVSKAERHRRRLRMIAINKERARKNGN